MAGGLNLKEDATTLSMGRKRGVYIVDDDIDVRKGLHFLLSASDVPVWCFASATDFLDQQPSLEAAPVLLDFRMPGLDGIETLGILNERNVGWPVIFMSAHGDVPIAVRALKLGAMDFLEKPFEPDILNLVLGEAFGLIDLAEQRQSAGAEARQLIARLSTREREILDILICGVPNKIAAHHLGLSPRTVEMHRANALHKLRMKSIVEVANLISVAEGKPRSRVDQATLWLPGQSTQGVARHA